MLFSSLAWSSCRTQLLTWLINTNRMSSTRCRRWKCQINFQAKTRHRNRTLKNCMIQILDNQSSRFRLNTSSSSQSLLSTFADRSKTQSQTHVYISCRFWLTVSRNARALSRPLISISFLKRNKINSFTKAATSVNAKIKTVKLNNAKKVLRAN